MASWSCPSWVQILFERAFLFVIYIPSFSRFFFQTILRSEHVAALPDPLTKLCFEVSTVVCSLSIYIAWKYNLSAILTLKKVLGFILWYFKLKSQDIERVPKCFIDFFLNFKRGKKGKTVASLKEPTVFCCYKSTCTELARIYHEQFVKKHRCICLAGFVHPLHQC